MLPVALPAAHASEETPRLRINYLAYPVEWNGKTIMIGARLQVPLNTTGKVPAVIMLHGTAGVRYSGVYYAAGLNRAGMATLEIDQWGAAVFRVGPPAVPGVSTTICPISPALTASWPGVRK